MFGTDLDSAYMDGGSGGGMSTPIVQLDPSQKRSIPPMEKHTDPPTDELIYTNIAPPSMMNDQESRIRQLEKELTASKAMNETRVVDSLYDRFLSKKKDVFKLLAISLTILLAMSTHFVMLDLLRNYLNNNDFPRGRETLIRMAYPVGVLFSLWSLKVFNK